MAQLDAHLTGDQEVVGLNPVGSATFFHGNLSFSTVIRSLLLIQEGQLSISDQRMCTVLING